MFTGGISLLMALLGFGFMGLMGGALFTYIRRTWQVIRSEEVGSIHFRILDELDRLSTQSLILSERLDRIEQGLFELREGSGPDPGLPELPSGASTVGEEGANGHGGE
jgi:hypothetical protein